MIDLVIDAMRLCKEEREHCDEVKTMLEWNGIVLDSKGAAQETEDD